MNISFRLLSKLFSLKLFKGLPSKFPAVRENMSNLIIQMRRYHASGEITDDIITQLLRCYESEIPRTFPF